MVNDRHFVFVVVKFMSLSTLGFCTNTCSKYCGMNFWICYHRKYLTISWNNHENRILYITTFMVSFLMCGNGSPGSW